MFKKFLFVIAVLLGFVYVNNAYAENIDLSADNGLEWNQKEKKISMHKNAIAKTPTYELRADDIEALYKDDKKIYKIFAVGNVQVKSDTETITTDKMTYNIDDEIIELFAVENPVVMVGQDSKMTAKKDVIYYKAKNYADAHNVKLEHSNRILFADKVKVSFKNVKGKNKVEKVNAMDNIKIVDGEEELYGDLAEYNPINGFAKVWGNVYFKKGSQANLSGGSIIYDMNTGIAKILPKEKEGKVTGAFSTETTSKKK